MEREREKKEKARYKKRERERKIIRDKSRELVAMHLSTTREVFPLRV